MQIQFTYERNERERKKHNTTAFVYSHWQLFGCRYQTRLSNLKCFTHRKIRVCDKFAKKKKQKVYSTSVVNRFSLELCERKWIRKNWNTEKAKVAKKVYTNAHSISNMDEVDNIIIHSLRQIAWYELEGRFSFFHLMNDIQLFDSSRQFEFSRSVLKFSFLLIDSVNSTMKLLV